MRSHLRETPNGVFTYSPIHGPRNGMADCDRDGTTAATPREGYVIDAVLHLAEANQKPTAQRQHLDFDFSVY